MKALVIGGAGYIGGHVVRAFLDEGWEVSVFDNLSSGLRENLYGEAAFIEGDILDYPRLAAALDGGFDAVAHLAALKAAGESMAEPEKYSRVNIAGTLNILNAMSAAGARDLVFSSSAAVFGEPEYLPVNEDHPLNPANYYGFTKLEIERFLRWYERLKGFRCAVLRYFNAAGYDPAGRAGGLERDPSNLIPVVMETAAGMRPALSIFGGDYDTPDGTCVRDYVHVSDLARAHVLALRAVKESGGGGLTLNLGSETGASVREVVEAARRVTGRPIPAFVAPRRPGDPARLTASSRLARQTLGWKPEYSDIESIVRSTWEQYRRLMPS